MGIEESEIAPVAFRERLGKVRREGPKGREGTISTRTYMQQVFLFGFLGVNMGGPLSM